MIDNTLAHALLTAQATQNNCTVSRVHEMSQTVCDISYEDIELSMNKYVKLGLFVKHDDIYRVTQLLAQAVMFGKAMRLDCPSM